MERTREIYMDINVSGRNFECKNEILTLKPENTVEVLDAFFAESKIEKVYEGKEEIYIVKAGDSLGSIANKKGTTIDAIIASDPNITTQNKGDIKVGQKIKIASQKEKGKKITFKRIENLEGKKTNLYLLIDAHSGNTDKEVIYHGQNPGKDGNPTFLPRKIIGWIWRGNGLS